MKQSLHLAHYNFNKNDNNDDKNNYSFPSETTTHYKNDDNDTAKTENFTNTSFDSNDENHNKLFAFTTTNNILELRPWTKVKCNPNKYGDSASWIL